MEDLKPLPTLCFPSLPSPTPRTENPARIQPPRRHLWSLTWSFSAREMWAQSYAPGRGVLSAPSGHSLLLQGLPTPCSVFQSHLESDFSVPELHKVVLQGKKCVKRHKYLLVAGSALVPARGREVGSVAGQVPLMCVHNTLFGELSATNSLLLEGYN